MLCVVALCIPTDSVEIIAARGRPRSSFGHSSAYTAFLRRNARDLPSQLPALAILIPYRGYATEVSDTPSGGPAIPPPGFNIKEAKKPLPKEREMTQSAKPSDVSGATGLSTDATRTASKEATTTTATAKGETKDEKTLTQLAGAKATTKAEDKKAVGEAKKAQQKLTIMQKVKRELNHYWDGTKLLGAEVKISTKLALKMAAGYELSRRENRQLQRTVQDLARLVPFSVFIIVPFAELLLPFALKLFPNMLPSTYEGQKAKDAKTASLRAARKEVSNLLRETLRETGLPLSTSNAQKEEFTEFFRKVRATGESPTHDDVIKVCKIFKDDLTLDNLSRPQLVGMCRYMNLNTFGTDMMLRYQIRHRMRQIKRDDRAISFEGIDSLSVPELQTAAASRGLRTHGVSPARLRADLQVWLDLRLKYNIPSTLLVLSNAFMYTSGKESEFSSQIDALQAVLSSIPEELFHEIELEVHNAEGAATNKQRLEVLKEQQELIEEENEQHGERGGVSGLRDMENIDEKETDVRQAGGVEVEGEQVGEPVNAETDAVAEDGELRSKKVEESK
ncbi:hypothetical protein FGG08_001349 [Glutinoglossum americanum]|uniref:Letm1 RBD domain-containing protein n=1 Tax=Glutinoglossum americanum TaxID=1670608 RepID=A0A9P8L694_9PEZI|nr:hypothetical protein FGG08_001349 [Glutinoglossum americanum]